MFSHQQLQELLSFEGNGAKVVSLYLDTDLSQESQEGIKLQARALLREFGQEFKEDVEKIEWYLAYEFGWDKPGLAVFSCAGTQFFLSVPINVAFRNRIRIGTKPYVKPLAHYLDYYAHYGVIMVDKIGARFFEYHLGELVDSNGIMGEEVRKLKRGGGSSATGMRGGSAGQDAEEETILRNLRQAAATANQFFVPKEIRRLFLGGTSETVAQFRELLSKQMQSCLAGTFALDMDIGEHVVRKLTLDLLRQTNSERETQLVEQLISTAAKGGSGVLGLDSTLQAINEQRVQTLILSDGYRAPGYIGASSGFLFAYNGGDPQLSGDSLQPVEDVVDEAIRHTMTHGGNVEVIAGNSHLDSMGYIGAILRY